MNLNFKNLFRENKIYFTKIKTTNVCLAIQTRSPWCLPIKNTRLGAIAYTKPTGIRNPWK